MLGPVSLFPQNKIRRGHLATIALCSLVLLLVQTSSTSFSQTPYLFVCQRTARVPSCLQAFSKRSSRPGLVNSQSTFNILPNF